MHRRRDIKSVRWFDRGKTIDDRTAWRSHQRRRNARCRVIRSERERERERPADWPTGCHFLLTPSVSRIVVTLCALSSSSPFQTHVFLRRFTLRYHPHRYSDIEASQKRKIMQILFFLLYPEIILLYLEINQFFLWRFNVWWRLYT